MSRYFAGCIRTVRLPPVSVSMKSALPASPARSPKTARAGVMDLDAAKKPYGSDAQDLFQQLCGCRDAGLLSANPCPGKAGMDGRQRNGSCQNPEKRLAADFMEQPFCDKCGLAPQNQSGSRGSQKRHKKPGIEPGIFLFPAGKCGKTGNGGLHTGSGQCMAYRKDGKNQLIDPHSFRTQSLCKEYLIEESKKAAQKSGDGQDQRPF